MKDHTCQSCGKFPAIFHYTIEAPDGPHEIHLCEKCIANLGEFEAELNTLQNQLNTEPHALQKAVDFLLKLINKSQNNIPDASPAIICPQCKTTLRDFKSEGMLGCPSCYQAFQNELDLIIPRLHEGSRTHRGKSPHPADRKLRHCLELEAQLAVAVSLEDYETAAKVRDLLSAARKALAVIDK